MSAGQTNNQNHRPWYLDVPGVEKVAHIAAILTFVGGVFWFCWDYYLRATTHPIAGYTDISVPSDEAGGPVFIRNWRLFNPGPGNFDEVTLEVDVSESYDADKRAFSGGLMIINGAGVTHTVEPHGKGSRIRIIPSGKALNRHRDICCQFHIRNEKWEARAATAILAGNEPFPANTPFAASSPVSTSRWWAIVLIAIGGFVWVTDKFRNARFNDRVQTAVKKQIEELRPNLEAEASLKDQKTLQQAMLPNSVTLPPNGNGNQPPSQNQP